MRTVVYTLIDIHKNIFGRETRKHFRGTFKQLKQEFAWCETVGGVSNIEELRDTLNKYYDSEHHWIFGGEVHYDEMPL